MPEVLQRVARYNPFPGIVPKRLFHDLRSKEQQNRDKLGVPNTTLDKNLNIFATRPKIEFCIEMGNRSDPSLWHAKVLRYLMLIYRNPENG